MFGFHRDIVWRNDVTATGEVKGNLACESLRGVYHAESRSEDRLSQRWWVFTGCVFGLEITGVRR